MKVTHISLWATHDDAVPRIKLNKGIITDKGGYTRLAVSDDRANRHDLPVDIVGWQVFVSRLTDDGDFDHVYEGTVARVERVGGMAGLRRVFYCVPGGLDGD